MNHPNDCMFDLIKRRVKSKPNTPLYQLRDEPNTPFSSLICLGCGKKANSLKNEQAFMSCAQCKAVKYCSRECQVMDWKGLGSGPLKPRKHKDICLQLKQDIEEFQLHPTAGLNLRKTLFSHWSNQHHPDEGTFHMHEFLCRCGLLGGEDVGFWGIPDVLTPYHTVGADARGFQNGQMLLKDSFPSMKEGWKIEKENEFIDVTKAPLNILPSGGIKSWQEYVLLRDLSKESVAPLLMTNVLTIYQMIQHELQLPALQKSLQVYVLAVESELNQIPLLQELLHLLPEVDLELIFLSPAAKAICKEAKDRPCILTRKNYVVLDVKEGNSRIRVRIDPVHEHYDDVPNSIEPDAVIGLNAGLGSYPAWAPTMHKILRMGTPFCFSDQTKLIHRFTENYWLPIGVIQTINRAFPNYEQLEMPDVTIALNPFHGIVGRDVAYMLAPNISNGYLITGFPI